MEDKQLMERFNIFTNEILPQALFHVNHKDKDDKTGAPLDDIILIDLLYENKDVLKIKDLEWFMKSYGFIDE